MGLFSTTQIDKINAIAEKTRHVYEKPKTVNSNKLVQQLEEIYKDVQSYFTDSNAVLIENVEQLHEYITHCIEAGYVGIDTETTGLDRVKDYVVGASLYYPGGTECYIPMKHRIPVFEEPYKNQLTYEQVYTEFNRLVESSTKLIFANADFDLSMIYKDIKIDLCDVCYYDVILAWRCIKEDELDNRLKSLYHKYVKKGVGDAKQFSDFFPVSLFPYCKPEMARLYAANDAKITFELFKWQLPYITKSHPKCQKAHLERIADLVWNVEFPLMSVCQKLGRTGIYIDKTVARDIQKRYNDNLQKELKILQDMVQKIINTSTHITRATKVPFRTGVEFNVQSPQHVSYLLYTLMGLQSATGKQSTDKDTLAQFDLPVVHQILRVRSCYKLTGTYTDNLPNLTTDDGRLHARFKQLGADTGRMCIAKGTQIQLKDGYKSIEDITPGDLVYCFDDMGRAHISTVLNLWHTGTNRQCVRVYWYNSKTDKIDMLTCTPEHPIRLQSGDWIRAVQLKPYDKLTCLNATQHCIVQHVEYVDNYDVYDIEVQEYHNFVANGICVHNSCAEPNLQNIPSHATDIRHMFRATPGYVMLSSDYSAQEPRLTAFLGNEQKMIETFQQGRDVYATIASLALGYPYEQCLEFHPVTHEYQPDGKARRGIAKVLMLGITYGMSVESVAESLYGSDESLTDKQKVAKAQKLYDSMMKGFPDLPKLMNYSQAFAKKYGYVETILGRRRHIRDMQLPPFEFKALPNYVNPDIDPLDASTLTQKSQIPDRIVQQLTQEFNGYKYYGQIANRTKQLYEDGIKVINNRSKIQDASRKCLNSRIQGSAADQTKMAMLLIDKDPEWNAIGGRLLVPVHDELIAEVPMENWERGAEILSSLMVKAAAFLPFDSKCDVEVSFRWYGLSYPCPYTQPITLENNTEEEIKWLQYHLLEMEYILPVYKNEDGSKPSGDAARGVNGITSDEFIKAIEDYISKYNISREEFIEHIKHVVTYGTLPNTTKGD